MKPFGRLKAWPLFGRIILCLDCVLSHSHPDPVMCSAPAAGRWPVRNFPPSHTVRLFAGPIEEAAP